MSWLSATEWFGKDRSVIWASDGKEIFQAEYREADICEAPEERLFIKRTVKAWLPLIYIWTGRSEPKVLPANIFSVLKNFSLSELLASRLPDLDRRSISLLYARLREKLPRTRDLSAVMEEAL